jgi:hypothetical protein
MQEIGNTLLTNNAKDADGCRTGGRRGRGALCGNIMHDTSSAEARTSGLKVSEYTRQMTKGATMQGTGWDTNSPWKEMQNTRLHKQPWFWGILGTSYAMGENWHMVEGALVPKKLEVRGRT